MAAHMWYRPRPTQAPGPTEAPGCRSPERSRSPRPLNVRQELPSRSLANCETVRVLGAQLEQVLGDRGRTLLEICRATGAHITLQPATWGGGGDDFLLGLDGSEAARKAARASVEALLVQDGDGVVSEDDHWLELDALDEPKDAIRPGHERSGLQRDTPWRRRQRVSLAKTMQRRSAERGDALDEPKEELGGEDLVVEEFDLPRAKSDLVIFFGAPRGIPRRKGLNYLQKISGVAQLYANDLSEPHPIVRLGARGTPEAVAKLEALLAERLDACADVLEELLVVPMSALGIVFGALAGCTSFAHQLEAQTGALLGRAPIVSFKADRALKTTHIRIRGNMTQIEHAKKLLQERLPNK